MMKINQLRKHYYAVAPRFLFSETQNFRPEVHEVQVDAHTVKCTSESATNHMC